VIERSHGRFAASGERPNARDREASRSAVRVVSRSSADSRPHSPTSSNRLRTLLPTRIDAIVTDGTGSSARYGRLRSTWLGSAAHCICCFRPAGGSPTRARFLPAARAEWRDARQAGAPAGTTANGHVPSMKTRRTWRRPRSSCRPMRRRDSTRGLRHPQGRSVTTQGKNWCLVEGCRCGARTE
jgi:hypothetical protein